MSLKEAYRYAVNQQVIQRAVGQSDAALSLNISVRQVKRLTRAIRQDRAPKSCLLACIDDATGDLMQACSYPVESTNACLHRLAVLCWQAWPPAGAVPATVSSPIFTSPFIFQHKSSY